MKMLRKKLADSDTEVSRSAAWILARIGSEVGCGAETVNLVKSMVDVEFTKR